METIKEFDFARLNNADKQVLYAKLHPLYGGGTPEMDLELPTGKSVWIDSAGSTQGHISVEDKTFRSVFPKDGENIYFAHDLHSELTAKAVGKVHAPASVVLYYAPSLRYMTPTKLKDIIDMYKTHIPTAEITVVIDIKYLIYHRFNLTNDAVIESLGPKKITKIGTFKYLLKF